MIDLQYVWLPQILRYARLISEEDVLRRAWLDGARTGTSVTGADELIEQVFGDLDSGALVEEASRQLQSTPLLVEALRSFIGELTRWDAEIGDVRPSPDIFAASSWIELKRKAEQLLSAAQDAGHGDPEVA